MSVDETDGVRDPSRARLLAPLGLAISVIALWVPVGFPWGTVEEWLILEQYLRGVSPLETGGHFMRPLVYVPFYLGYALTPGSFVGLNLLHMGFLWGKSVALYSLLCRFGLGTHLAFACAMVFLLYPADDGQLTLRTVAIQGALMLFLLAVSSLVRFAVEGHSLHSTIMVISLATSILVYESSFPLAFVSPLLLLLLPSRTRSRAFLATALWYVVLVPLAARYAYYLAGSSGSYQASVLAEGHGGFAGALRALGTAYYRSVWRGWASALASLFEAPAVLLLLAGVIAALSIFVLRKVDHRLGGHLPTDLRRLGVIAIIGLVVVGLGFSMYLPTSVRESTWRTYFLPSLGGALLTVAIVGLLSGWKRSPRGTFAWAIGLLVLPAFTHLSLQHRGFAAVSQTQQALILRVEKAVPRVHPRTRLLLLFDETDQVLSHGAFPFSRYFRAALVARLGLADTNVHICYPFTERRGETCELDSDQVRVEHQDVPWAESELTWEVDYDSVIALVHDVEGNVRLLNEIPAWYSLRGATTGYDPGTLVDVGDGFRSRSGALRVEFDEGRFVGGGWSFARTTAHGVSYRFMTAPRAAVHLPLESSSYHLRLRIANGISPELLGSLSVAVGETPIRLRALAGGEFEGWLDEELVRPEGEDTVLFFEQDPVILHEAQSHRGSQIGLGFDWLHLQPIEELPDAWSTGTPAARKYR